MKRVSYKDTATGIHVVLEDVSYNNACWWIDNVARINCFRVLGTETVGNKTRINCTAGVCFYYDEARGLLLGEGFK